MKRISNFLERIRRSESIRNASWTLAEKCISGFGLVFVTSYVARYIGPNLFGKLTLAAAIFQVAQIIAQMGSDNIVFKRTAKKAKSGASLIRATTNIRILIYLIISIPTLLTFIHGEDAVTAIFFLATCVASFFTAWDAYVVYNNALLRSKVNAITNLIGLAAGLTSRYSIAKMQLDPAWLAAPIIATTLIPLCIRSWLFQKDTKHFNRPRSKIPHTRYLLAAGGSVVLASIAVAFYTRIGQFMLSALRTDQDLGVYAAALTLSTSWAFVSMAFTNSFFPAIYAEKDEELAMRKAVRLNRLTIALCGIATVMFIIFGRWAVSLLYGAEFKDAYFPGIALCVSASLSALGSISYRYIIRHSGYSYLSKKMLLILLISPAVYAPLISNFGIMGAAIGALLIEFMALTIFNYAFKSGIILRLHKRTIFA